MLVEYAPLDDLVADPRNARRHDRAAIRASLTLGLTHPLVVRRDRGRLVLVAGHGRAAVLREMRAEGLAPPRRLRADWSVPVVVLDVSEREARRHVLADNASSDRAGYDLDALEALVREVAATDADALLAELGLSVTDPPPTPTPPETTDPEGVPEMEQFVITIAFPQEARSQVLGGLASAMRRTGTSTYSGCLLALLSTERRGS